MLFSLFLEALAFETQSTENKIFTKKTDESASLPLYSSPGPAASPMAFNDSLGLILGKHFTC